jgi:hypothetical protein
MTDRTRDYLVVQQHTRRRPGGIAEPRFRLRGANLPRRSGGDALHAAAGPGPGTLRRRCGWAADGRLLTLAPPHTRRFYAGRETRRAPASARGLGWLRCSKRRPSCRGRRGRRRPLGQRGGVHGRRGRHGGRRGMGGLRLGMPEGRAAERAGGARGAGGEEPGRGAAGGSQGEGGGRPRHGRRHGRRGGVARATTRSVQELVDGIRAADGAPSPER